MAITPNPIINDGSTLLLNQAQTTYQITFKDLSENVLNIISGGGTTDPILEIGDNLDVNTNLYISQRDAKGLPAAVTEFDDTLAGALNNVNDLQDIAGQNAIGSGQKHWMLQWVPGKDATSGFNNVSGDGQFVLRDPMSIFKDVVDSISGDVIDQIDAIKTDISNLELNSLNDVSTRNGNDTAAALSGTIDSALNGGGAFLYATDTIEGADGTSIPHYKPQDLVEIVEDKIVSGDITIDLENINNVNPDQPGALPPIGRLKINDDWSLALGATVPKYAIPASQAQIPLFDDILVYISDPSSEIEGAEATDTVPGWFYAEASFGDGTTIAGSPSGNDAADDTVTGGVKPVIELGSVRVLEFKNTELEFEVAGDKKSKATIKTVGTTPTNIGITADGVLYSDIPNTLTFRQVIDIDDSGTETFAEGGVVSVATDAVPGGPGFWTTPDDAATNPSVGDFYVIRLNSAFTDPVSGAGTKTLGWRLGDGSGNLVTNDPNDDPNATDGSRPIVEDGDMVAWGGNAWSVIGTVNTSSIAQNLQSVTARGKTTDLGIELTGTSQLAGNDDCSIRIGTALDGKKGVLSVGSIDFSRFPVLTKS